MNIGIFGATGFIGAHLIDKLGQFYTVRGFSSTVEDEARGVVKGRYDSSEDIGLFVKNLNVAIYAAGAVSPRELHSSEQDIVIQKSIKDLQTCLEIFFLNNPNGMFIFFSSAGALYPNSPSKNNDEESPLGPLSFYGLLKFKQEELISKNYYDKNVLILRPSNVFGDPFKKNKMTGVVDRLIASSIGGEVVNIFENLSSERDFLYIGDLEEAVLKLLATDSVMGRKRISVYNLSSHEMIKLSEIILKVQALIPQGKSKVCFTKIDGISNCLKINSSKFRKETGWAPVFNFERALVEIKKVVENHV